MEIGNVIKEYRKLRNMTQEELAAALLVTPQAVSRWETGLSYPDIAMIPEIVKVLGVSADKLLGCDNAAEDAGKEQAHMLDYRELVASVQEMDEKMLNQSQIDSIFDYVPHPAQAPKMVLIIDDSDFMRMMVTDILSHEHHRVLQAASGEEGLNMLKGETCGVPVDVCILDIKMPGMNGLQVLEHLPSCLKQSPSALLLGKSFYHFRYEYYFITTKTLSQVASGNDLYFYIHADRPILNPLQKTARLKRFGDKTVRPKFHGVFHDCFPAQR